MRVSHGDIEIHLSEEIVSKAGFSYEIWIN